MLYQQKASHFGFSAQSSQQASAVFVIGQLGFQGQHRSALAMPVWFLYRDGCSAAEHAVT